MAIKGTTKSKQTRQAQSNFKKWEKEHKKRGTYYVPMTTKSGKGIGKWYVSNRGTIISFNNSEEPTELPQTIEKSGYKKVGVTYCNGWVDRVVWFSFRDTVREQRYNSDKIKKPVKEFLIDGLKDSDIVIHHINRKKTDNRIENLIALPRSIQGENLHQLLHNIQKQGLKATKEQFLETSKTISNLGLKEPTMFIGSDDRIEPIVLKDKEELKEFEKQINIILGRALREQSRQELQNYFNVTISDTTLDKIFYIVRRLRSVDNFIECIKGFSSEPLTQEVFDNLVNTYKVVLSKS